MAGKRAKKNPKRGRTKKTGRKAGVRPRRKPARAKKTRVQKRRAPRKAPARRAPAKKRAPAYSEEEE